MTRERLAVSERIAQEAFRRLNMIFQDYNIAHGGKRVGEPQEGGKAITWLDVLNCYKEDVRALDLNEEHRFTSDLGFLILLFQSSDRPDEIPGDVRVSVKENFVRLNS